MCQEARSLSLLLRLLACALAFELRHRLSDREVETLVQGTKVVRGYRLVQIHRQLRDRLANVAIVMDQLVDREPDSHAACAVIGRGPSELRIGDRTAQLVRFQD